jgi:hypothetical protein
VPGISEVLHAEFVEHAYPPHTHDTLTVFVVDEGQIRYNLDRHDHGAGARWSACFRLTSFTTGDPRQAAAIANASSIWKRPSSASN